MGNIRLISVNVDNIELDRTFAIKELEKDFWNDCLYVPSNDDEIKLVEIDGINVTDSIKIVNPYFVNTLTFWDVTEYLGWN